MFCWPFFAEFIDNLLDGKELIREDTTREKESSKDDNFDELAEEAFEEEIDDDPELKEKFDGDASGDEYQKYSIYFTLFSFYFV